MRNCITPARARRTVARAKLSFEEHVCDPRDPRGRRHSHRGLLNLLVVALAAGKRTLRAAEDLGVDLCASLGAMVGLERPASDSTEYRLLQRQAPEGFREVLQDQVRRDVDRKAIQNDLFPGGMLTIDGKGAGSRYGEAPNPWCRSTVCDDEGTPVWHLYALRASLTSSSAAPYLDQEFLDDKTGETTAFPGMLARNVRRFPRLFRYITADAEFTSAKNALEVLAHGKFYVFGLKANRRRLYDLARCELVEAQVAAVTTERYRGKEVRRELRRARCPSETRFPGAKQFWAVRRLETAPAGTIEVEDRIFITNTPWAKLTPKRILQLVRLHWRIENNGNWTADMVFGEDSWYPCYTGNGVVAFSWLRLLAFNLVAVFRAHLPAKDGSPTSWARALDLLHQALLLYSWLGGPQAPKA